MAQSLYDLLEERRKKRILEDKPQVDTRVDEIKDLSQSIINNVDTATQGIEKIKSTISSLNKPNPSIEVMCTNLCALMDSIRGNMESQSLMIDAIKSIDTRANVDDVSKNVSGLREEVAQERKTQLMILDQLENLVRIMSTPKTIDFDEKGMPVAVKLKLDEYN